MNGVEYDTFFYAILDVQCRSTSAADRLRKPRVGSGAQQRQRMSKKAGFGKCAKLFAHSRRMLFVNGQRMPVPWEKEVPLPTGDQGSPVSVTVGSSAY